MNVIWNKTATKLYKIKQARRFYEKQEKYILEELLIICGSEPTTGETFELKKIVRTGTIQYSKVKELYGICLNKYRRDPIISWILTEKETLPIGDLS